MRLLAILWYRLAKMKILKRLVAVFGFCADEFERGKCSSKLASHVCGVQNISGMQMNADVWECLKSATISIDDFILLNVSNIFGRL